MPSSKSPPVATHLCGVRLPYETMRALVAEAARRTAETGRVTSIAAVIRSAVIAHLAGVQRVANPSAVEG